MGGVPVLSGSVLSDSALQFTVPADAVTGAISVDTPGGTATSGTSFIVVPSVSTVSPSTGSASAGTQVTFAGYGLEGIVLVQFGTVTAAPKTQTATGITVDVPAASPQGAINIILVPNPAYGTVATNIIVPFTVYQ